MQISIRNRVTFDVQSKEMDRETGFYLYANLHKALDAMNNSYTRNEKGEHKYFYTGYDPEYGSMHMGFEVEELCEEARKVAQSFILEVASFFEVEASYIDHIKFFFF